MKKRKPPNMKHELYLYPKQCHVLKEAATLMRNLQADMQLMSHARACDRFVEVAKTWFKTTDLPVNYWDRVIATLKSVESPETRAIL